MGLFSKNNSTSIKLTWNLENKNYQYVPKKEYDKLKSLDNFLEKEQYSYTEVKKIMQSNNPIDVVYRKLADNPHLAPEYEMVRTKQLIILNLIHGLKDGEIRFSTRYLICSFFGNLILCRCGVAYYGQKYFYEEQERDFINQLAIGDKKALYGFYDEVAIAIIDYCNTFNISLIDFMNEVKKELSINVMKSMPLARIGNIEMIFGIICRLVELSISKKKYSMSKVFK